MIRSFGVAFFVAALVGVCGGGADAKSHSAIHFGAHGQQSRAQVHDSEISSNMPTATADVQMWAGDSAGAHTSGDSPGMHASSGDAAAVKGADPVHRFARGIINRTSTIARSLTRNAMRFIGTPYVFGGTSPSGFDCSGYVQYVFAKLGIHLPRTADVQYYAGHHTDGGIQVGDLVFFQTYLPGPSHVGIYMGGGKFIHSCSHGVMISRLRDHYWAQRYLGAKRVVALR